MIMLMGTYTQSVDAKGRMAFPAKLREAMGEGMVLTRGVGGCIFVYTREAFEEKVRKLNSLPMAQALPLQRTLVANAAEIEPDKQGRVLVPARLRTLAGINDEAVVAGVSDHCEIWSLDRWNELNDSVSDDDFLLALKGVDF